MRNRGAWEESGREREGWGKPKNVKLASPLYYQHQFSFKSLVSFTIVSICRHDEYQYLDLINQILEYGSIKDDRTGVGTKSIFRRSNEVCSASTSPQDIIIAIF